MINEHVGERLVRLAAERPNLPTQRADLAKAFGVSYETLRKWMTGASAPNRRRAAAIAKLLQVPEEVFMHGADYEGEPTPHRISLSEQEQKLILAFRQVLKSDRERILTEVENRANEIKLITEELIHQTNTPAKQPKESKAA